MKTLAQALLLAALTIIRAFGQETLVVDPGGAGDFTEVQPAVDAARDGDTVLVKPGEYVIPESIDFNRLHNPRDPASPPVKNIVVRAEAGPPETTIRLTEEFEGIGRVVNFSNGESATSVLEGFTLTGGKAGGVFFGVHSSPTLKRCAITGNRAIECGGGIYCWGSPTLIDCTISENSAFERVLWEDDDVVARDDALGGGVYCGGSSAPVLTNCTISRNRAAMGYGGGVYCGSSSAPVLTNCTISQNCAVEASGSGGGIFCGGSSSPRLTNCALSQNDAEEGGGIFYTDDSSPTLMRCTITGNVKHGVAANNADSYELDLEVLTATLTATDCTIVGNSGSGMDLEEGAAATLKNCTIADNVSSGVALNDGAATILKNCVVWNNPNGAIDILDVGFDVQVAFSCTPDVPVWPGEGNINVDPLFRGPGDYRLRPGSPCIDSGTSADASTTDIEGNGRPCGHGVDMGAYESGDCPPPSERFSRGDTNADGDRNVTDAVVVLDHLFGGGTEPPCAKSADANDNGTVDIADPVFLLNALFAGGTPIPSPFPDCGPDPTPDELSCQSFAGCD